MSRVFEKYNLINKNALITGAAGLLGIEHAFALLEAGASVVLTDINVETLQIVRNTLAENFHESRIHIYEMNIKNQEAIQKVADQLLSQGLRVDILINNAAVDPKIGSEGALYEASRLEHFSLGQWEAEVGVGLTGAFLCSQIFGTAMAKDKKGGVILNIASDLSVFAPDQRIYRKANLADELQPVKPITYSVIKAGLIGLTRYLATYWADNGIRSNALSPGGVFTNQDQEFVKKLSALIPLGRMARKDEYRSAIQFLCSDASSYMNGQNIVIDGGRSVW